MLDRLLMYHRHLESLRKKLTWRAALLRWLVSSSWGAGATTLRIATWCIPVLIPASLTPPSITSCELWLDACILHQWTTFLSLAGIHPAELCRNGTTLFLARRAVEPGHLLHSGLTCPSSANTRCLKSRHPFVPATQHLISSSDNNNIHAAQWANHQWNAKWFDNPTWLCIFIPDTSTHQCQTFPLLLVQMGCGLLCGLWVWRRRTNRQPCCPPMSNPSTSPWTAWPDSTGQWDSWMAAQHVPRI